jgi:hypothetical protein
MIEPISRGVLDTRLRGYDSGVWASSFRNSHSTQDSVPI